MKNVLIITTSLRNGSNSDMLAEAFKDVYLLATGVCQYPHP